ncbi:MAG: carboxypeptidase regulatory-like domain-containing protein [Bacteroidetes bacterium]|nr:carboxypeptidase regulatory-like domain-containing protein [Bacteroidota bacterium]
MRTIFLLVFTLTTTFVFGQSPSGTVKGTVKSPSGTPLSRVSVQAANSGKSASTDDNGSYTLPLPAGNYEITYSAPGHTPQTVSVTITPGATIVQDIILATQSPSIGNANPTPKPQPFFSEAPLPDR